MFSRVADLLEASLVPVQRLRGAGAPTGGANWCAFLESLQGLISTKNKPTLLPGKTSMAGWQIPLFNRKYILHLQRVYFLLVFAGMAFHYYM